ncbi:MAG TPA: hypothetical protein VMS84_07950 [Mycobacterium sp.]|jgi:hypothetical protein|nr:hypothetical protein [Mycobacterium sp.]
MSEPTPPAPPKAPQTAAGREQARRVAERKAKEDAKSRRIWCAYNADGSSFVLFGQKMQALEYAIEHHHDGCKAVEFGVPLLDQIT